MTNTITKYLITYKIYKGEILIHTNIDMDTDIDIKTDANEDMDIAVIRIWVHIYRCKWPDILVLLHRHLLITVPC